MTLPHNPNLSVMADRAGGSDGVPAHSKSEYKRRVAQGDPNVLPPTAGVPPAREPATEETVLERAKRLYAESPTYRGTRPLGWYEAPQRVRRVWLDKAKGAHGVRDWHPCRDVEGATCADQDECANGCIRRRSTDAIGVVEVPRG